MTKRRRPRAATMQILRNYVLWMYASVKPGLVARIPPRDKRGLELIVQFDELLAALDRFTLGE